MWDVGMNFLSQNQKGVEGLGVVVQWRMWNKITPPIYTLTFRTAPLSCLARSAAAGKPARGDHLGEPG